MVKKQLSHVFGVSRDIPETYVERPKVDEKFRNNLARDKHIVIYGRSKQGKTSLHKNCLNSEDYIVIQCRSNMDITGLYAAILKEAGATVSVTEKETTSGTRKIGVEFLASGNIPWFAKAESKAKGESEKKTEASIEKAYLEIDPSDPNDVIRILESMEFQKFIMLEDFHYLERSIQIQVAIDLKAFHEKSSVCCFIIVGVWLEPTRLILYNGDLAGRLIPIDADVWADEELMEILNIGEALVNIQFPDPVKEAIVTSSQGNVGILQETCWRLCSNNGIFETLAVNKSIGSPQEVDRIVEEIAMEQSGRYQNLLRYLAENSKPNENHDLPRWIAFMVITSTPQELIAGIPLQKVSERIREYHPTTDEVNDVNVHSSLLEVVQIQHKHRVQPLILDFDGNVNVLRIVDSGFILYTEAVQEKDLLQLIDLGHIQHRADPK